MTFDHGRGKAPLLTVFGGDVTTSRLRAERAVSRLTPFYPMSPRWTAKAPLPGGDFAWERFDNEVDEARERWRFLGEDRPGVWSPPMARTSRRSSAMPKSAANSARPSGRN